MKRCFKSAFVLAVTVVLAGSSAQAVVIAYEGFDYTAGESLVGQNGGSGFTVDGWTLLDDKGGSGTVTSPGLAHAGTTSEGLASTVVGLSNGANKYERVIDTSLAGTAGYGDWVSGGKVGVAGKSVWISLVLNASTDSHFLGANLLGAAGNKNSEITYLGKKWNGSNWTIGNDGDTGIDVVASVDTLLVAKVEWASDSSGITYSLWVDPTDVSSEAAMGTADGSFTTATWRQIASLTIGSTYSTTFDEIRIGTELLDVTTVPEPATMALLGVGGIFALRRRR